jgi:hypothetical protein
MIARPDGPKMLELVMAAQRDMHLRLAIEDRGQGRRCRTARGSSW